MKLYLIRHGQTDWNVEQKIQGHQDIPLNAVGHSQAAALAEGMKSRPVKQIFSSPQKRAMQTAQAVAEAQNVPVIHLPSLMEIGYGAWEGRTMEEIRNSPDQKLFEDWWKHPATVAPPGGETLAHVDARCRQSWEAIKAALREHPADVAIVSHGGTLAHLIACLLAGQPDAKQIIPANVGITTIAWDPQTDRCHLLDLNNIDHLKKV